MSSGTPAQRQQLEDAFLVFNQVSEQLADSYAQLQKRVAGLNQELAAARSERMRQLAEKERLANRLSTLLDGLPAGVVLVDGASVVQQYNPAAKELLPSLEHGNSWQHVFSIEVEGTVRGEELSLRSGRLLTLSERSLDPEDGRILLMLDVTETRQLQERVERQNRLSDMGQMAAQLAHQIRTPLSSALLYTAHLSRDDLSTEQRERFSSRCRTRLLHMERQINDMLAFARGGQFEPEEILLDGLDIQLLDEYRLCGNRDALLGALSNLATNALDHGGDEMNLRIELRALNNQFRLRFEDDGPGIPEDLKKKVFDPFFTTRTDGTGLGLAVVQSVVLGHKGRIRVLTPAYGGSCFELTLPRAVRDEKCTGVSSRSGEAAKIQDETRSVV
jgi:two-component system sensor histidine kinase FlrB